MMARNLGLSFTRRATIFSRPPGEGREGGREGGIEAVREVRIEGVREGGRE